MDLTAQPLYDVPLWWGGNTPAPTRLAVEFCQGWLPGRIPYVTYDAHVGKIREMTAEQGKQPIWVNAVPVTNIADKNGDAIAHLDVDGLIANANIQRFWLKPSSGEFTTARGARRIDHRRHS